MVPNVVIVTQSPEGWWDVAVAFASGGGASTEGLPSEEAALWWGSVTLREHQMLNGRWV